MLKVLQKHYYGKIKMIYIDPPYNTGKDFVYPDNYADPIGSYLDITGQRDGEGKLSTNSESAGRFHSNWLNMMYPRLKLARNLMREDGILLISIDDKELKDLLAIVAEIFGEQNQITTFIWQKKRGGGNDSNFIAVEHEYVVMVCRSRQNLPRLFTPYSKAYRARYRESDDVGPFYWDTFKRKSGKQYYPITCPDGSVLEFQENGARISWLRSEATFKQNLLDGEVRFVQKDDGSWSVQFKQRMPEGKKPRSLLNDNGTTSSGSQMMEQLFDGIALFDNPKPVELIKYLVGIGLSNDDIVLDFFAGSGTTAHAVMALNAEDGGNRRCISVQLPEPTDEKSEAYKAGYSTISEITRERIRRAGKKILEEEVGKLDGRADSLDAGFRAYRLVDTNFAKWRADSSLSEEELTDLFSDMSESADDDARPEALLTEVLLKLGFSLTEQIEQTDVAGLDTFIVDDGLLIAYLNEHVKPTLDQLRVLVALEPARLVVLEDAFQGDDELKTNLVQECRSRTVELWTV